MAWSRARCSSGSTKPTAHNDTRDIKHERHRHDGDQNVGDEAATTLCCIEQIGGHGSDHADYQPDPPVGEELLPHATIIIRRGSRREQS